MTQVGLDHPQIHPGFEQMRGIRMAQRVNRRRLRDAALSQRRAQGALYPALAQRGWAQLPGARGPWKEPDGVAMRAPELAQPLEKMLGQGHIAIFVALSETHVDQAPLAVNIAHLKLHALVQAQATGVDGT